MNTTPHPRFAHLLPASRGEGYLSPRPAKRGEGGRRPGEGLLYLAMIAILIAAPIAASACPVCYGTQQTPLTKSAGNGVLFLLGIVGSVQVGFVALFVSFWKRTKALQQNVGAGSQPAQLQIIEGGKER